MSFIDVCDHIIKNYKSSKDFAYILKLTYLKKYDLIDKFNLEHMEICKKKDLLFYGKNYPLFKSLYFFNDVPVFKSEKESILFLKTLGFNPRSTLKSLTYEEKLYLGNEILKRCMGVVSKEYHTYLPHVIFGEEYYFKGVCLREYVSTLNGLCKIGKSAKVKRLIIDRAFPDDKDIREYKKILARKISLFRGKFEKYNINYFNLEVYHNNYKCQYFYVKPSIWDRIRGLFIEGIDPKYYPTLINIPLKNVNYLMPFFIFVSRGKEVSVYARVPKLIYLKDNNISLNFLNLKGKYTYFGNWNEEFFYSIINRGKL